MSGSTVCRCAASVFWLPYQAYSLLVRPGRQPSGVDAGGSGGTAGAPSSSPLGDSALLLLLVLLFHSPPQVSTACGCYPLLSSGHFAVPCSPCLSCCDADLAAHCLLPLLLLLLLLQDAPFGNPYRQSLQRLQDADDLGALHCRLYCCAPPDVRCTGIPMLGSLPALNRSGLCSWFALLQ